MKATIQKHIPKPVAFERRSLTIEFHSQKELDAFGTLFNNCKITDALEETFGLPIGSLDVWEELRDLGADNHARYNDYDEAVEKKYEEKRKAK